LTTHFIISPTPSIDTRLIYTAIIYVCRNCHNILLIFDRPGHEYGVVPSPSDLKYRYQLIKCPKCGREISFSRIDPIQNITIVRRGEALKIYGK